MSNEPFGEFSRRVTDKLRLIAAAPLNFLCQLRMDFNFSVMQGKTLMNLLRKKDLAPHLKTSIFFVFILTTYIYFKYCKKPQSTLIIMIIMYLLSLGKEKSE